MKKMTGAEIVIAPMENGELRKARNTEFSKPQAPSTPTVSTLKA